MKTFVLPHGNEALRKELNTPSPVKRIVTVDEYKPKRSLEQNARLWAILTHIAEQVPDENGRMYSPETWLEFFKGRFLGKDVIVVDGETSVVAKRSSKLKVMEFAEFMTQVEAWGVDHNVKYWSDLGETG